MIQLRLTRNILGIVVFLSLAACGQVSKPVAHRPKKNTQVSETSVKALLAGNMNAFYENIYPSEIKGMELTPEKVTLAYQKLISAPIKVAHATGQVVTVVDPVTLDSTSLQHLRDTKGTPGDMAFTASITTDGPKVSFVEALVSGWLLESEFRMGRRLDGLEKRRAVLDAVRANRGALAKLGISQVMRTPDSPPISLAEWEEALKNKLEEQERNQKLMAKS